MPQTEPSSPAATPRRFSWRRLVQYRLRTLLIVVTAVAVWLGWWSHNARRQRAAVATLTRAQAVIRYDFQSDDQFSNDDMYPRFWPAWLVDGLGQDYFGTVIEVHRPDLYATNDESLTYDLVLEAVSKLDHLQVVNVEFEPVNDRQIEKLQRLSALKRLRLDYAQISDDGLASIGQIKSLESLSLWGAKITNKGLAYLHGLTNLQTLDLTRTAITDAGLKSLAGHRNLRTLCLGDTKITDAAVQHLASLTSLTYLHVGDTEITSAGLERLKKSLPQCKIDTGEIGEI